MSNEARVELVEKARDAWVRRLVDSTRRNNLLFFRDLKSGSLDIVESKPGIIYKLFNDEAGVSLRSLVLPENFDRATQNLRTIKRKADSNLEEKGLQTLFLAFGMATWPLDQKSNAQVQMSLQGFSIGDLVKDEGGKECQILAQSRDGTTSVRYADGEEATLDPLKLTLIRSAKKSGLADPNRPPLSPVILLPILCEVRGQQYNSATLIAAGPPQVNMVLAHGILAKYDVNLDEEFILGNGTDDDNFDPMLALHRLIDATSQLGGFEVTPRCVVCNFSFQKLSMVRDLKESTNLLVSHDMISALAGDQEARDALGGRSNSISLTDLDAIQAECEYLVLDADSSQQAIVHNVASDLDGVIQGPPGCGKSQTIANVISTLVAQGKRVLFVAEKRAALEAVYGRLETKGLGHLALDLHGASISQKSVMSKISASIDHIKNSMPTASDELHGRFEDRRQRMISHAVEIHKPQQPSGLSVYELQEKLTKVLDQNQSKTRWRTTDLAKFSDRIRHEVRDLITDSIALHTLILGEDDSLWTNAQLNDGLEVQIAIDAAERLGQRSIPELTRQLSTMSNLIGIDVPTTVGQAEGLATLMVETCDFLREWNYSVFEAANEATDLAIAKSGKLSIAWASITQSGFRNSKRRMISHHKHAANDPAQLLNGAIRRDRISGSWAKLGISAPHAEMLNLRNTVLDSIRLVSDDLSILSKVLPNFSNHNLEVLVEISNRLSSDSLNAHSIPKVRQIKLQIDQLGLSGLFGEIRTKGLPPENWHEFFDYAFFASCLEQVRALNSHIGAFRGQSHDQYCREFQDLDRDRLKVAALRVCRAHAERAIEIMNSNPEQTGLIRQEAAKSKRHLPLRKLFTKSSEVLTSICPCWMSSPLNVSQLLPPDKQYFDVVIFDEASQVLTEDAVCSILRGKRLVAAGDKHQLPPTTFFADGNDEEGELEDATTGFESLLDSMEAFIDHWFLEWHYRSRDERLISFSNRWVYGDRLVTFPGISRSQAISYVGVDALLQDGDEESGANEVRQVVAMVLSHAERQKLLPNALQETLGVITMGIKHADRIQAAVDNAIKSRPDLDIYFDTKNKEPFFVKNIERVQGDERDQIILTLGYTKGRGGKFNHNLLGPVLGVGGYRRLNVAITRARNGLSLVSGINFRDVRSSDVAPVIGEKGFGVHLFRMYLQFAESGGSNLGDSGGSNQRMNAFEADIFNALSGCGVNLVPQYGSSRFRIDFAARHPERVGEFVLAIEADGATYHSSATARDRDRIRQEQLENLGWRFHRIWSTEWFVRREESIKRAVVAWRDSIEYSDLLLAGLNLQEENLGGLFGENIVPVEPDPPEIVVNSILPLESQRVGPRPIVRFCPSRELTDLIVWIRSDGRLRTDDELITEALPFLGRKKRMPWLVDAIMDAISDANNRRANVAQ